MTKEGEVIPIRQLKDSHLLNIVRMLKRHADTELSLMISELYSFAAHLQGEMASYYIDQDINRAENTSVDDFLSQHVPAWDRLIGEVERRKLMQEIAKGEK